MGGREDDAMSEPIDPTDPEHRWDVWVKPTTRETARQIVEQIVPAGRSEYPVEVSIQERKRQEAASLIEAHVASLTAALAQAQQETEQLKAEKAKWYHWSGGRGPDHPDVVDYNNLLLQLAAAEQARAEARKERDIARSELAGLARDLDERNQSAARTALLEAAARYEGLLAIGHIMADTIREETQQANHTLCDQWQQACAALFDAEVRGGLTTRATEGKVRCANCGHTEPHNGPAGSVDDACTHPMCKCGYFQAEHP